MIFFVKVVVFRDFYVILVIRISRKFSNIIRLERDVTSGLACIHIRKVVFIMAKLTSVHADRIKPAQSKENLSIVRTELPAELKENAKFATGFVAVPNFNVHIKEGQKFGTVELGADDKVVKIQYTDKAGERQTAETFTCDLAEAHAEATKAYRAQRTAAVEKEAPEATAEAAVEAEPEA